VVADVMGDSVIDVTLVELDNEQAQSGEVCGDS